MGMQTSPASVESSEVSKNKTEIDLWMPSQSQHSGVFTQRPLHQYIIETLIHQDLFQLYSQQLSHGTNRGVHQLRTNRESVVYGYTMELFPVRRIKLCVCRGKKMDATENNLT